MIRPFGVSIPASILGLALFEILAITGAFVLSIAVFAEAFGVGNLLTDYVGAGEDVGLVLLSFFVGLYFQDLYHDVKIKSVVLLAQQLAMVVGIVFLLQALITTVSPDLCLPLRIMMVGSAISVVVLLVDRLVFSAYVLPLVANERLLLFGGNPILDDIAGYVHQFPQLGIQIAGHVQPPDTVQHETTREMTLNLVRDLEELFQTYRTRRVVVGICGGMNAILASALLELQFLGYSVQDAAETYANICNRESLFGLGPKRLLYAQEFEPLPRALLFQAFFNWLIAAICSIVLLPVMLLVTVAAWLCWGGPVFKRQIHRGRYGVPFSLYGFRGFDANMFSAGNSRRRPARGGGQEYLGRFLSRTGLYVLPELFNVFRGHMSIVGPRPQRPEFFDEMSQQIPFYPHRLKVLPGITGWSQVQMRRFSGPLECTIELEYDLYYLKYFSLRMDLFTVLQALKNVLLWGGRPFNVLFDDR